MTRPSATRRMLAFAMLTSLIALTAYPAAAQEATPEPIAVTFGPGPFNLLTPTVGLAELSSYRATLTVSFRGTTDGQQVRWSRAYSMTVTQTPPARQLTVDMPEDAGSQLYMAEVNGTFYERRGGGECVASAIAAEGTLANTWEPAAFLGSVIGADEASAETVNSVAADRYMFDERAVGGFEIAETIGDLWIAADGGYLVRYVEVTTGGADYFGTGTEGTITWTYGLTDANQSLTVAVPEDCPPGILELAILPDAADVIRMPGFTSYTTPSGLDAVLAFYQDQVAALGAQPSSPPVFTDTLAMFGFVQSDEPYLIVIDTASGGTSVEIFQMADSAALAIAAEVPDLASSETAVETGTPSGNCALGADNFPTLADASSVQRMSGLLSYMTSTSVTDAAAFYEEQITALGGRVTFPVPASDLMAMLEARQEEDVFVITIIPMGGASNVTITFASMNPLAPPVDCDPSGPDTSQSGTASEESPATCAISSATGANQRSGPGTNFELAGKLAGGVIAAADGQATGADGFVWWRLGEGVWVRSDVVDETGNCDGLPLVQP